MDPISAILSVGILMASPPPFNPHIRTVVSAGGGASFTDTFNRADSNPMSDPGVGTWTQGPGFPAPMKIVSNQAAGTASGENAARVLTPTFNANQKATITFATGGVDAKVWALVRMQSTSDASGYLIRGEGTTVLIEKVVDNGSSYVHTTVGSSFTVTALVAGDTLGISASGTGGTVTLEGFINGVSIGTRSDSTTPYISGQPGIYAEDTFGSRIIESFTAVDL
jgi:hypothetical protein